MKRFFPHQLQILFLGIAFLMLIVACQQAPQADSSPTPGTPVAQTSAKSVQLAPLPYDYAALEPHIDAQTMRLHHDRHHQSYVDNLNKALAKQPNLQNRTVEQLLRDLNSVPEDIRTDVRNNGGGHLNHTMFWQIMSPQGGGDATGAIAQEITKTFGSFQQFKDQFNQAASDRFGSGWVWLVRNSNGQLQITTTPNQDTPIMDGSYPIMGNDVWEHAYYLRYQNERAKYLDAWWNVVNWNEINRRYQQSLNQGI
ncbi:superoxide dismutase [Floridanema aerugineum]|uniref:Superoxide dismutase n=1 Tax=Floridaenema aerugineum BLCC-F46 TaxID=3153654 RepID=A0ABV4X1X8_9CYAN